MAEFVVVRTYPEPVEAQLDRARLASEGIEAIVIEPTGYNPALTAAAGGVLLKIDPADLDRAEVILRDPGPDPSDAEEDDTDEVRCPRCELTYCAFERPTLRGMSPGAGASIFAVVGAGLLGAERKRWHCHKCEHVWDDRNEGPRRMTRLLPGDPRPVFRLRRAHPGMGLFLGIFAGLGLLAVIAAVMPGPTGGLLALCALLFSPVAGWMLGRSIGADVCSEPKCREVLPQDAETCPGCRGSVAGRVSAAAEHYAAAGDFRRELAAVRARDEAKAQRKAERKAKKKAARA